MKAAVFTCPHKKWSVSRSWLFCLVLLLTDTGLDEWPNAENFSSYTEMQLLTVCDRNLSLFNVGPFLESHGHFAEPEPYFKI